jgi:hypothetical protein
MIAPLKAGEEVRGIPCGANLHLVVTRLAINNGRTEEAMKLRCDDCNYLQDYEYIDWCPQCDGPLNIASEPHPVSSGMQPHEARPDLTARRQRVEGTGQSVKDPAVESCRTSGSA